VAASPDPVASSDRSSTERLDGAAHAALERALLQGQAPDRGAPPGAGPSRRRNSDEQEENLTKLRTAQEVKDFMNMKEGSTIRAWLRHFDLNNDLKISHNEFVRGLKKLDYHGDPSAVFIALDVDHSQELSLQEIDEAGATVWQNFRAWCVERFSSTEEMLERLRDGPQQSRTLMKRGALTSSSPRASAIQKGKHAPAATLDLVTFTANLKLLGYGQGFENIVFQALVGGGGDGDSAVLGLEHLKWFEIEKRRQRRKEQARKKAALTNALRKSTWKGGRACLNDFKAFLKRTHGNYIRGWRMALSPTDSMVVSKGDVFKACTHMGWQGDVRLLYKTLDKDDSGYVSMEELDPYEAQVLAHFHIFVGETFGNAASAFQAFDKSKLKKLRYREFVTAARSYGFKMPSMKLLFNGLDKRNAKAIVQEDLLFLDKWKCPPFLHVPPNQQAAEEVKMLFLKHYKTFVKAWRMLLDADSSNRCTYSEWEQGCKKIGFQGDTPGAWRALDRNFSGYITLREIDEAEAEALRVFAKWCVEEFGGVRSAFSVFDASADNEVSYREFRRACRIYGYDKDVQKLFRALDVERNGTLTVSEVMFLDDWEFRDIVEEHGGPDGPEDGLEEASDSVTLSARGAPRLGSTTEFSTDGPGPAAYDLPGTIGMDIRTSCLFRSSGAYSFRRKLASQRMLPGISRDAAFEPSPADYDEAPGRSATTPAKPSWGFGTERRPIVDPISKSDLPGPDTYCRGLTSRASTGPSASCTPRRPLRVHPLFKAPGVWS